MWSLLEGEASAHPPRGITRGRVKERLFWSSLLSGIAREVRTVKRGPSARRILSIRTRFRCWNVLTNCGTNWKLSQVRACFEEAVCCSPDLKKVK